MKYSKIILLAVSFFSFISCMNKYEKEVVGKYELYKYDLENPLKGVDNFSQLKLNNDKTFELKYAEKIITGHWSANDNGDWTFIEFEHQNKKIEARVGRDEILFNSANGFGLENFKSLEYTKIEK